MASSLITAASFDTLGDSALDGGAGDKLPEGTKTYTMPKFIRSSTMDKSETVPLGTGAQGRVHKGNEFISGRVTLAYNGFVLAEQDLSQSGYQIRGLPVGVNQGESVDWTGTSYVKFQAEDGSVASKDQSAGVTSFYAAFGDLSVTLLDADGNPVPRENLIIADEEFSTDSAGQVNIGSSGNVEIRGVFGTVTKNVTVPDGGSASAEVQYAGVHGTVRTATGVPVSGATVYLALSDGSILAQDETDSTGEYSFPKAPPGTSVILQSEPFTRAFSTGGEGENLLKMLPFETEDVGGVEVEITDAKTGDPVVNIPALLEKAGFGAKTTDEGTVVVIGEPANGEEEMTVSIGKEDRRFRSATLTPVVVAGETVTYEVELERRPAITRH